MQGFLPDSSGVGSGRLRPTGRGADESAGAVHATPLVRITPTSEGNPILEAKCRGNSIQNYVARQQRFVSQQRTLLRLCVSLWLVDI
jgi:hypothetical protein